MNTGMISLYMYMDITLEPEQIGLVQEQIGLVQEQIGLVREQIGLVQEQIGLVQEQIGLVQEQIGLVQEQIGLVQEEDIFISLSRAHLIRKVFFCLNSNFAHSHTEYILFRRKLHKNLLAQLTVLYAPGCHAVGYMLSHDTLETEWLYFNSNCRMFICMGIVDS